MKRVMLAVLSSLLLSCQGPAAVMAQEAIAMERVGTGASALVHRTRALDEGAGRRSPPSRPS